MSHPALAARALAVALVAARSQAQSISPFELAPVSPDGDASEWILDGERARHLAAGVQLGSTPWPGAALVGACGPASVTFAANAAGVEGDGPTSAAFTADATRLVIAHAASRNLVVLDASTRAVVAVIALSGTPNDVAVSSDNVHAVTANIWENTASIVDLASGLETAVVPVGTQPSFVRCTPGGTKAVVGNAVSQSLSVIDVASASELWRIPGAGFQSMTAISFETGVVTNHVNGFACASDSLAVHPDNLHAEIDFYDLAAGTVTSVACDPAPRGIAVTPDGSKAVVSHYASARRISVIDTATRTIANVFTAPNDLDEPIAINPTGTKAAAAIFNGTQVVDLATGAFSAVLPTASVNQMHSTPDGLYALAVGFNGSLISYATNSVVTNLNGQFGAYFGAVAPLGQRAAMIGAHANEDVLFVNTNGASGFVEGLVPTGPPPEADATRDVAISANGVRAVTTNTLSHTASVFDVPSGALLAVVPVGLRPADVALTHDGSKAVVANLDSTYATVIDTATFAAANVPISTRGSEVEISPDGRYAYVAVVSSGDGVWRIDLATNTVAGAKLATADMGSTGFMFNQASGMTLSHDGATLAVCGSFSNAVTLIDTASWSVAANVPVGTFPVKAAFSTDDATLYVSNKNSGTVSVVSNAGAASAVIGTLAAGAAPFELAVDPAAQKLYVACFNDKTVRALDLAGGGASTLPFADYPQGLRLSPAGSCLYVASGNWTVSLGPGPLLALARYGTATQIDTATFSVSQSVTTGTPPATLEFDAAGGLGLAPDPLGDGLTRIELSSSVTSYCTAKVNTDGCAPHVYFEGAPSASAGAGFEIGATLVIAQVSGIFFYSTQGPAAAPFQGGWMCAQAPIRRTPLQNSGGAGNCGGTFAIDFNGTIADGADPALVPGATFWGQYWSRDSTSPSHTNLTDAIQGVIGP